MFFARLKQNFSKMISIIIITLAITLGLNVIVNNPYFHAIVRSIINEKSSKFTNIHLDYQAMNVSILPLEITLYGIKATPTGKPGAALLEAAHITARLSPFSLFMGTPHLTLLEFNELSATYPLPLPLNELFPFLANKKPQSDNLIDWPPFVQAPITRLVFINSNLQLSLPSSNKDEPFDLTASIRGLNLNVRDMSSFKKLSFGIHAQSLELSVWGGHVIKNGALKGDFRYLDNRLFSDNLALESSDLNLKGGLNVNFMLTRSYASHLLAKKLIRSTLKSVGITYQGAFKNSDLAALGRFLSIDKTSGSVEGTVNVAVDIPVATARPTKWIVDGTARSKGAKLYDYLLHDSKIEYRVDENFVTFPKIEIIKDGRLLGKARGSIAIDPSIKYDFDITAQKMPLSVLLPSLGVTDFNVFDTRISSPKIKLYGKGVPFRLIVESPQTDASEVTSELISFKQDKYPVPPDCKVDLHLAVDMNSLNFDGSSASCKDKNSSKFQGQTSSHAVSPLKVNGNLYFNNSKGAKLTLKSSELPASLLRYFTQTEVTGSLHTELALEGPYDRLVLKGNLKSQNLALLNNPISRFRSRIEVPISKKQLLISDLAAETEGQGSLVLKKGTIRFDDNLTSRMQGHATALSSNIIKSFASWYGASNTVSFRVDRFDYDFNGPLLYPLAYKGTFDLELANGKVGEEVLFSKISAGLSSTGKGWQSDNISYQIENLKLMAAISHKWTGPFSLNYASRSRDPLQQLGLGAKDYFKIDFSTLATSESENDPNQDVLSKLPYLGKYFTSWEIDGGLDLSLHMEGRLDDMQGNFESSIIRPTLLGSSVGTIKTRGFIDNKRIDVSEITQSGKSLLGRLKVDLGKDGYPFDWYFAFRKYDLRAVTIPVFYNDPRNYAYFSGSWRMNGKFADFWRANCEFKADELKMAINADIDDKLQKESLSLAAPTTLTCSNGLWKIAEQNKLLLQGSIGSLELTAHHNRLPDNLDIKASGRLNISSFQKFMPMVDKAIGTAYFDGSLTGSIEDPELFFSIKDAATAGYAGQSGSPIEINISNLPPALKNVRFEVLYQANSIEVKSFSAEKGVSGRIQASGAIALDEAEYDQSIVNFNFTKMELNRLPIPFIKNLDTTVSGHLSLIGNRIPLKLMGSVNIEKGQSYTNVDIRNQILESFQKQRFATTTLPSAPVVEFDVQLEASDSIKIKNRGINAVLASDLYLRGTDVAPTMSGSIGIPNGTFLYKREFKITHGDIIFDELVTPPDPRLNITGETTVSNYTITVNVTGPSSDVKVALSIDPATRSDGSPISEKDILLLLSSGRSPDVNNEINMEKELSNEALYLLLGQFEHPIERIFDMTGQNVVRHIYLDVHTSKITGGPMPRVNLPINITDDANLVLQVDQESNLKMTYEYSLHENISATGSIEKESDISAGKETIMPTETDPGVDLKFRFNFP
jgi:hypothetical protein